MAAAKSLMPSSESGKSLMQVAAEVVMVAWCISESHER